jgi:peptidoglycan hydrolase CwlO-like protein
MKRNILSLIVMSLMALSFMSCASLSSDSNEQFKKREQEYRKRVPARILDI